MKRSVGRLRGVVIATCLALSLFLHGVFVASVRISSRHTEAAAKPQAYVEFQNPVDARSSHTLKHGPSARKNLAKETGSMPKGDARSARGVPSSDFGLHNNEDLAQHWSAQAQGDPFAGDLPVEASGDPARAVGASGEGWSRATQYSNAMGLEFTNETLGYFQALHSRVDGALVYPDDIANQRIQGLTRVEAELSRDGRLVRFISSNADNDILQAYAMTILIYALEKPLPRNAWLDKTRAFVSFDFDFRIQTAGNTPPTVRVSVEKNRLFFGRVQTVQPWLNEKIIEVFTHYVPPIIPIPGGFYIDFVLAYQYVKNLADGTPPESEARKARVEALHQDLRQTIRRREMPGTRSTPAPDRT